MPITRVELRANRLRHRRDNRKLRASNRETRHSEGDTLANSAAETPTEVTPREAPAESEEPSHDSPSSSRSDASQGENSIAQDGMQRAVSEQRLCDLKAVFSGSTGPLETLPTDAQSESMNTDSPMQVSEALQVNLSAETAIRRSAGEQRRSPTHLDEAHQSEGSDVHGIDPNVGQSRLDLITGEWTWFATTRSQRPDQFGKVTAEPTSGLDCPFCSGSEHRTPNPVWTGKIDDAVLPNGAYRTGAEDHSGVLQHNGDGHVAPVADWSVRVVPNLYPAVTRLEDAGAHTPANQNASERAAAKEAMPTSARRHRGGGAFTPHQTGVGYSDGQTRRANNSPGSLFPAEPGTGGHEVIVESPRHIESLGELNTAEISLVFAVYAERIRYWRNMPGVKHVTLFKNVGRDAGASLQHSHSQLIATNRVPAVVQQVTRRLQAHHARVGSCLQCDLLRGEVEQKSRLVSQTDSFVAYCPFASRFPMQVRLTSKEHLPCFSDLRAHPLRELARLTLRVVRWLEALRPSTPYNVLLHTCPVDFAGAVESQHWAMDIFPRVSRVAGFELATGAMINPIYPETAAKAYRAQARLGDPRYVLR